MPARRAMSSVEVPSKPRPANSTRAASRTSSLRSAAERRTAMPARLVMTHKLVKGLRHPVEIGVGELPVEGQRERAVARRVGAGERALVAVGAEAVERVGADLALDALRPQSGHDLVAAVDLDDVGLQPMTVAGVGFREDEVEVREPLAVAVREPL